MHASATMKDAKTSRRGFSLIELALVLGISGLMLGFVLQSQQSAAVADCYIATKMQLRDIDGAIQRFARQRERLPLPAARNVGVEAPTYGREASGGAIDAAGGTSWGALPFQALGLAPSYASDCWGNKLTYVVTTALTTNATVGGYLDSGTMGNITVRKDAATNSSTTAAYAIISHGEDALGAVKNNYSSGSKGWCSGAATLTTQNCLASAATVASAVFNNGRDAGANYFDDVIIANGRPLIAGSNVLCWGNNTLTASGALGDGTTTSRYYPARINSTVNFTRLFSNEGITVANAYFCALTEDGTPYCWGDNSTVSLGSTSCNPSCSSPPAPTFIATPTIIPGGFKFKTLSIGSAASCGIVAAGGNGTPGEIRCWGSQQQNSMGNSTLTALYYGVPQPLAGAAAGVTFSKLYVDGTRGGCALTAGTGEAWCWGRGSEGQIGNGAYNSSVDPTPVLGGQSYSKLQFIATDTVCGLTRGSASRGRIYCWGSNNFGQLGRGTYGSGSGYTSAPTITVSGGTGFAATARVESGQLVGVTVTNGGSGYSSSPGEAVVGGGGTGASVSANVNGGVIVSVAIRAADPTPREVAGGQEFVDMMSGSNIASSETICGIKSDGQALCWGGNTNGVAGVGTSSSTSGYGYTVPPAVTFTHTQGGAGTGAAGTAVLGSGGVVSVTMTNTGSGYIGNAVVMAFNGGDGYGAAGNLNSTRGGPIGSFTITNPGSGYTSQPTATVTATNVGATPGQFAHTNASGCMGTINGSGNVTGITCASYGDNYRSATVALSGGGGTGATATVTINAHRIIATAPVFNNASVLAPTAIGGALRFLSIVPQSGAMLGLGTDNRLYSWGFNNGSNFNLGNNGVASVVTVPTLLDRFLKNSASGAFDTNAAGISFSRICGVACALDSEGKSYRWRSFPGNGASTNFNLPSATCPTTATAPAPACGYKWAFQMYGGATSAVCGIEDSPALNCAAQTVNWGACTQNARATVNGEEIVLYDITPADRGSITATCNKGVLVFSDSECSGVVCTVDGGSSGGNPASCCNGDSDGNGTCGTQASCTPCVTYQGSELDLYGTFNGGAGCWNYNKADCSTEADAAPCDGTTTTPPAGWSVCP